MSSRKLTRSIVAGAAAIAVAGGTYGIVSATSSSSPAAASSGPAAASSGFSWQSRIRIQRPVRTGRRGSSRHGQQRVHVGIHAVDINGSEGDRRRGVLHDVPEGDELNLGECR